MSFPARTAPGFSRAGQRRRQVLQRHARRRRFADLEAWLEDDHDLSGRALIGGAGTGKTRAAIELCRRIDGAREPGAWSAGFLDVAELRPVVDTLATRDFDWTDQILLVIDTAAQGAAELGRWLDRLA